MPNKKNEPEFVVSDRRRFSVEGETRSDVAQDIEPEKPTPPASGRSSVLTPDAVAGNTPKQQHTEPASLVTPPPGEEAEQSAGPTAEERAESNRAYRASTDAMDEQLRRELGGQASAEDFKVGFDRIVEPLYVTALVQLGFMGQEGVTQRRVDIIGARQSIDALSLLQEKTKGNLSAAEVRMLEDVLYDIRMKYLEITNALARAVQNPPAGAPSGTGKA